MKKLLTVFSALALFAACKGKTADANTAAATTTTPATNTPAPAPEPAPAADPKADFIAKGSVCVCDLYTAIAEVSTRLKAAPAKEKPAIEKELQAMSEKQPECVTTLEAEENKLTASMNEADKKAFQQQLESAVDAKCPDAKKAIQDMNK